jgi:hypothetical protein
MKITLELYDIIVMLVASKKPIPQHILDKLSGKDMEDALDYNKSLEVWHWHVRGSGIGYAKDIAFFTEQEAIDAENMLWNWETGGDEDKEYKIGYEMCDKAGCRVYVG